MTTFVNIENGRVFSLYFEADEHLDPAACNSHFRGDTINHYDLLDAMEVFRFVEEALALMHPTPGGLGGRYHLKFSFGDVRDTGDTNIGFCARRLENINLIPNPEYMRARGYPDVGNIPNWQERSNRIFWRGAASYPYTHRGKYKDIPRVKICELLKSYDFTDVKIYGGFFPDPLGETQDSIGAYLKKNGLLAPSMPFAHWAQHRYTIDIDGFGAAWGLFAKLRYGLVVFKIESDFVLDFSEELAAWKHYIPVAQDLSDLLDKISYARAHPDLGREISQNAVAFAKGWDYRSRLEAFPQIMKRFSVERLTFGFDR